MLTSQTQTYAVMANITQSDIKGTTDPSQISLGEDEEMHALSYYIYREHREGSSLKNSLYFIFQDILD